MIAFFSRSIFLLGTLLTFSLIAFTVVAIDRQPVRYVSVLGDLSVEQLQDVKRTLATLDGAKDASRIKAVVESLAWVSRVNVSKDWESGLVVDVQPEQALAYWNDDAFINEGAETLVTELLIVGDLPHLYGPLGSELEVMQMYRQLARTLAESRHSIEALTLTDRGSWQFETSDRLEVFLGKDDVLGRMERFLRVSQSLDRKGAAYTRADARYPSGVAVQVAQQLTNQLTNTNQSTNHFREHGL